LQRLQAVCEQQVLSSVRVAVCDRVLHCVAVCCVCCSVLHVLQRAAMCCSASPPKDRVGAAAVHLRAASNCVVQLVIVCCRVLQCVAECCRVLQSIPSKSSKSAISRTCVLQCVERLLQCVAVCCSVYLLNPPNRRFLASRQAMFPDDLFSRLVQWIISVDYFHGFVR